MREKFEIADAARARRQTALVAAIDGAREQSRLAAEALDSQESRRWQLETEVSELKAERALLEAKLMPTRASSPRDGAPAHEEHQSVLMAEISDLNERVQKTETAAAKALDAARRAAQLLADVERERDSSAAAATTTIAALEAKLSTSTSKRRSSSGSALSRVHSAVARVRHAADSGYDSADDDDDDDIAAAGRVPAASGAGDDDDKTEDNNDTSAGLQAATSMPSAVAKKAAKPSEASSSNGTALSTSALLPSVSLPASAMARSTASLKRGENADDKATRDRVATLEARLVKAEDEMERMQRVRACRLVFVVTWCCVRRRTLI
jgi:hypothetical protein